MASRADTWFQPLDPDIRSDWTGLREVCLRRFALPVDDRATQTTRMEELFNNMDQGLGEKISEYLERADDFDAQYGIEKNGSIWKWFMNHEIVRSAKYNLIPINKCMAIIVYLVYSLDEVVDIALKAKFTSHFTADALFFG